MTPKNPEATVRIAGLKRTGLYMGYYTFESSVGKNLYVHYFSAGGHGSIARRDGTEYRAFLGLAQLRELLKLY
jgi:hypothetical protein